MYCQKCGTENPEGAQLCQSCNWVLASNSTVAPGPDAKTSGLAIAALVLMILSFFTFFLTAIPAIICGIVALVKIEKSNGRLKGKGLAITGIAAPAALLPLALLMGILMPALGRVRGLAQEIACGANIRVLGRAMMIYANDNDGNYPTASKWCDLLTEYSDTEYSDYVNEKKFQCQAASEGPCNYAMNKNIEKLGEDIPPDIVLLFESPPGWNQSGGPELLTTENHQGDGCNIFFGDGHVSLIKSKDTIYLKWTAD